MTRREFLNRSAAAGCALSLPRIVAGAEGGSPRNSPNNDVRVAIIGLGSTTAVGGVGGRGHQLIPRFRETAGVKIAALCDVDQGHLDREAKLFRDRGEEIATVKDLRRVLDDKTIDAVVVALPNHWHALATVWACQAGKDVYVEKPFSHNLWEGAQMAAAARKYSRIVQVGTQNRSSSFLRQAFDTLRRGEIGAIRYAHALVFRARDGIGKTAGVTPVPPEVDYDLWCGPAPLEPLKRQQLHYEWHWFWATGNGEMGNNGIHVIDIARWALGQHTPPRRALSLGGRLAFDDCGETANTHIALFDYEPAPLICEIRNVRAGKNPEAMGKFRNQNRGLVIDCEGGYFAGDSSGGALFDKAGKKIKDLPDDGSSKRLENLHIANFIAAIRSRKAGDLSAEAMEGHHSTACCHLANISHRLGRTAPPETIREMIRNKTELADAFDRCQEYLRQNGVDLEKSPATLGPWLTFDSGGQKFVGDFAAEANAFCSREYRPPFVVPKVA